MFVIISETMCVSKRTESTWHTILDTPTNSSGFGNAHSKTAIVNFSVPRRKSADASGNYLHPIMKHTRSIQDGDIIVKYTFLFAPDKLTPKADGGGQRCNNCIHFWTRMRASGAKEVSYLPQFYLHPIMKSWLSKCARDGAFWDFRSGGRSAWVMVSDRMQTRGAQTATPSVQADRKPHKCGCRENVPITHNWPTHHRTALANHLLNMIANRN